MVKEKGLKQNSCIYTGVSNATIRRVYLQGFAVVVVVDDVTAAAAVVAAVVAVTRLRLQGG